MYPPKRLLLADSGERLQVAHSESSIRPLARCCAEEEMARLARQKPWLPPVHRSGNEATSSACHRKRAPKLFEHARSCGRGLGVSETEVGPIRSEFRATVAVRGVHEE